jgi:hypothetical protein
MVKPEIRRAIENPLSIKEKETTMNDFFNNTTTDQHDHVHARTEHDDDPNNGNKPNSKSKHEKRNQHKQKKESKDMNRIIKNSIAPVLAAFAVSMAIIFGSASDTKGFEVNRLNADNLKNDVEYDNLKTNSLDDESFINYERISDVKVNNAADFIGDKDTLFAIGEAANSDRNNFTGLNQDKVTSAKVKKTGDDADQNLAGVDADKLPDYIKDGVIDADMNKLASFGNKINDCNDEKYVDGRENKLNDSYGDGLARFYNEKFYDVAIDSVVNSFAA